jgi:hypothetical protein
MGLAATYFGSSYFGSSYFGAGSVVLPTPITPVPRLRTVAAADAFRFTPGEDEDGVITFPDVALKDPSESILITLDCYEKCIARWQPNTWHALNEYVRPVIGTGYAYRRTQAGNNGSTEPRWPKGNGLTVVDGAGIWQAVPSQTYGINAITSPAVASDPVGITVADISVEDGWKILAKYSGGVLGRLYDLIWSFTLNGVPRVARHQVRIEKR